MAPPTLASSVAASVAASSSNQQQPQQQAQQSAQQQRKPAALPSTKVAAALDIENNVPLSSVQVDALAVMKIVKHCRESFPSPVTGHLLGLDVEETLEIANCFPLPTSKNAEDIGENPDAEYQQDMMRCLKEVNVDNNTVGWYQSTRLGSFVTQGLVETQFNYQKKLSNKAVVLIHDVTRSSMGNLSLRAFRLSESFMKAYEDGKFTAKALDDFRLSHVGLFEELPVRVKNSHLVSALLAELEDVPAPSRASVARFTAGSNTTASAAAVSALSSAGGGLLPNYDNLDLSFDPYLEQNLEALMEGVEDYNAEQGKIQYLQRQAGRDRNRLQYELEKRREENAARVAAGQEPIPEDDILATRKVGTDPSRLDSLLIASQIDGYCKQLNQFAGPALSKLFVAGELQK